MRRGMRWMLAMVAVATGVLAWWPAHAEAPPIVAVFNVEAKGLRLAPDVLDRLSDYLAGRLAEGGRYQVVPRDQLKDRLVQKKKDSYRQCYAQSCQIELGQELAAQKTMASQVMKLGSQCKATVTLFDLARATAENSATTSGECTEDGIVASLDAAVAKLLGTAGTPGAGPAGRGLQAPAQTPAASRPASVPAAPEVEDSGPRVKRSTITASVGDLTIQGKAASGAPVRLEVTDPSGKATVSGSPFKDPRAAVGSWKVVAKASGHEPEEQSFQVPPDDVTVVKIDLKPFGGLRVTGEPAGAAVKVTGPGGFRDEGGLPWEAEGLRSGAYRVEATRPGYDPQTQDVTVEPGRTAAVTMTLTKAGSGLGAAAASLGGASRSTFRGLNTYFSFLGLSWGDPESRVPVVLGPPKEREEVRGGWIYYDYGTNFRIGTVDGRVAVIRLKSREVVDGLARRGISMAGVELLGLTWREVAARIGRPADRVNAGNYEYDVRDGAKRLKMTFICYDFWQEKCNEFYLHWFY